MPETASHGLDQALRHRLSTPTERDVFGMLQGTMTPVDPAAVVVPTMVVTYRSPRHQPPDIGEPTTVDDMELEYLHRLLSFSYPAPEDPGP